MKPVSGRRLSVALTLILVATACGGSDPGDDASAGSSDPAPSPTHEVPGDDGGHHPTADGGDDPAGASHDTGGNVDDGHDHSDDGHDHSDDGHDHSDDGHDHSDDGHDHGDGGHAASGAPTRYDADVANAVQTITIDVVDGGPVGGVQRVEVDLGSVVGLMVTSDIAEEVHVHGYDILRAVSDGHPAHFAFTAEIPGVFEVEFEGSGRLLMQLEIS